MSQLEKIGVPSHKENFFVFLALGIVLGVGVVVVFAAGYDTISLESIVQESIALRVFFFLIVFGLTGLSVSSCLGIPTQCSQLLQSLSLRLLRVGLSTGFIASGVTIGYGAAVFIAAQTAGFDELSNSGLMVFKIGFFLMLIVWPFLVASIEILKIKSAWIKSSAIIYSIVLLYILYKFESTGFWQSIGIYSIGCIFFVFQRRRLG